MQSLETIPMAQENINTGSSRSFVFPSIPSVTELSLKVSQIINRNVLALWWTET